MGIASSLCNPANKPTKIYMPVIRSQMGLIEQQINELTLLDRDATTLLWEVLKQVSQNLQAQISFLIPFENLPETSWSKPEFLSNSTLATIQEQLKTIVLQSWEANWDDSSTRTAILGFLDQNLSVDHWEVCLLCSYQVPGWLILGSTTEIGLNHSLEKSLHTPLCVALKTAQLKYQVEKNQRYKQLQQKITEAIHNSQDLETILHCAIAQTSQTLEATRGMVFMLRYAEPIFTNRQEISAPKVEVQPLTQWAQSPGLETQLSTFPLTASPLFLKAWQQAPSSVILNNETVAETSEPSFLTEPYLPSTGLIAPLMGTSSGNPNSQMVLGFLLLQDDRSRHWEPDEQELVNWVSTQASTAILHNKTLQQVQSLVDERTAQLQRSLDVQAKLYETSRHQVEQLQQLNQLKDEFLATISHELNTPLATMKMAIQMLHRSDLSPERRERYLGILEQEWQRENNLIKDLLTLQTIEKQGIPLEVQSINLEKLLMQLIEKFQSQWSEKGLNLNLRCHPLRQEQNPITLDSDPDSVQRICSELLTNAGKYATANTTVDVAVSQDSQNWIQISVTNVGYGIAPAEQHYVFDQFRRGKGVTQKAIPGTGLGLALVKSLVKYLHGKIDLDSDYNPEGVGETTFYVTLPRTLTGVSPEESS